MPMPNAGDQLEHAVLLKPAEAVLTESRAV